MPKAGSVNIAMITWGQKQSSLLYLQNRFDLSSFNPEQSLNLSQLQSWVAQQNPQQVSRTDYQYDSRGQLSQTTQYTKLDGTGLGITDGSEKVALYL